MKTAINKAGSQVHQQRPLHRIRHHQPHAVVSEQLNELLVNKTLMANLNGMSQGSILADLKPRTVVQTLIVAARQLGCLLPRPGQHGKEKFEPLRLELEVGRELP